MMMMMIFRTILLATTFMTHDVFVSALDDPFDFGLVEVATSVSGTPGATTTYVDVIFYHDLPASDAVTVGVGSVSYFYAGCSNPLPTGAGAVPAITGVTTGSDAAGGTSNKGCGPTDNESCEVKTTYQFKLQELSEITNGLVKTVDVANPPKTTIKFCVRRSHKTPIVVSGTAQTGGVEQGYKFADVTVSFTTTNGFAGSIETAVNGPGAVDVDVGNVAVQAVPCTSIAGANAAPADYSQGEQIELCLWATVTLPNGSPNSLAAAVITEVNSLRFWIDNPLSPNINNVYDQGEITQTAVVGGVLAGSTTIFRNNNGGPQAGFCVKPFATAGVGAVPIAPAYVGVGVAPASGCVLTTFLSREFFFISPITQGKNTVRFAGSVTLQFRNGNRRLVVELNDTIDIEDFANLRGRDLQQKLNNGDQFGKDFAAAVTAVASIEDDRADGRVCITFFLICWIADLFACLF